MKFDINNYPGEYVMHCRTEEEAKIFLKYLDSIGKKWRDGCSYLERTCFNAFKDCTCYCFNEDGYCDLSWAFDGGYGILRFEDFDWSEIKKQNKIIAVDFDGTLCENKWPEIGPPRWDVANYIMDMKRAGAKIILWTCRQGKELLDAIYWCRETYGLVFDAVNENVPEIITEFGHDTRKIFANEYIDDKMCTQFKFK